MQGATSQAIQQPVHQASQSLAQGVRYVDLKGLILNGLNSMNLIFKNKKGL